MAINEVQKWPTDKPRYNRNYELVYKSRLVVGFEDYVIIPSGEIFSLKSHRFLSTFLFRGYKQVTLCKNGKMFCRRIHRLVLETFVGPCPEGMECCHNDGNSKNNNLENLKWGTKKENTKDALRHGTHHSLHQSGIKNSYAKLTEQDVRMIIYIYIKQKIFHNERLLKYIKLVNRI